MNKVKTSALPHPIQTIEHVWIPMRDGCRLSARIWMPKDAETNPVPAILEYIPYRKRDLKRSRDTQVHSYFAAHGYAAIRVDIRGSGDSEGVLKDEYLQSELDDGVDILNWLEEQPWCNGKAGMIGISWGGFNGLQIAAMQPPQLKAVISLCSTDDRYADDVHYMGGCLLNDNLSWASTMFAFNSLPPDPGVVGEKWRDMWMERLNGSGLWVDTWMRHQQRDDYWKHGSVCEDYSTIKAPVLAVSGWADGYSNAVFRLVQNLDVTCKGLVGPWSHIYPHEAAPGPQIGFLQECLRWWDRYLKDEDTGVEEEPDLRVWMQETVKPRAVYKQRPGYWVAEHSWPSGNIEAVSRPLDTGRILEPGEERMESNGPLTIQSPLSVGLFAGKWCSYSKGPDLPYDQREEDGGSLVFDSEPLEEDLVILGAPKLHLELSSSKPVAMIAVRLSDIAEDDKATRVTYGLLNLCHRNSHEFPEYLEPGKKEKVTVELNDIAQHFPKGHRVRIAISTSYWPLAWPSPEPVRLTIHPENSSLELPVRKDASPADDQMTDFEEAEAVRGFVTTVLHPSDHNWVITRDLAREESTLHVTDNEGTIRLEDIGTEITKETNEWYRYLLDKFESPNGEVKAVRRLKRGDWNVETVTRTVLTCTSKVFRIHATLDAYENGRRIFSKIWDREIPRTYL
ncbi:CocE/NonD family hydrolase [Natronogracilivirga saccharolytica]|uniref:CocE/NonD family hydrolase n=1 Tax=Natronogracilivirga saccharolytica TaxID=2812953 RepID=A0A8J7UW10_9BACT|nr:CocE/NonD family hydrolase [Natronogracilivirga saccharolytica]MBP3191724.1 CocE/NonD family hydrolase [Natronogracilivirga saccharolytica]